MDTVQKVKEKLSIVDVVSPYVKLTKAGRYHKGLSPFNKEKTASFFVNPERGSYYCFSSGQGGDMFTFIEKMEGVDFKGALKLLAEKAGVPLEYTKGSSETKEKNDRLFEAMARAEQFYARHLVEEGETYKYALSRGLTKETISAWGLGFAPDAWRSLLEELTAAGFSARELLDAGLIKEAEGKGETYYDRFRNRLMFPIRDSAGRVVAFTGRTLGADEAKYLNSPETDLFKKSKILFGMDRAKDAIRSRGFTLLVEGQFDLILLHQIGFTNTIALSGTALSREHLELIKRYTDNLMLALDADRAGLAASAKNAHAALLAGTRIKAVRIPLGKDPADLAKDTPQDFVRRVSEAESIVEFFLSVLSASEPDIHRRVVAVERVVLPLIKAMKSPMEQEHFVGIVARALGSSSESVRASLKNVTLPPEDVREEVKETQKERSENGASREQLILAAISTYEGTPLAKRLKNEYSRIIGSFPDEVPSERALFEAGLLFGEAPPENAGDDLITAFERSLLTERLHDATRELRRFESMKDEDGIKRMLAVCKDVGDKLAVLA